MGNLCQCKPHIVLLLFLLANPSLALHCKNTRVLPTHICEQHTNMCSHACCCAYTINFRVEGTLLCVFVTRFIERVPRLVLSLYTRGANGDAIR